MTARKTAEAVGEAPETATHTPHTQTGQDVAEALAAIREQSRNVHQRLNDARRTIRKRAFSKDLANKQFSSVSIDAMRDAVQEAIIAAGLNLVVVDKEFQLMQNGATKTFMGTARMRVINIDDPEDYVDYWTESFANDNGDKGLSKWDTGLLKTAYKEIFQIGVRGEDDIDSKSNVEVEEEAERIEAIRQRREANRAKAQGDRFFGKPQAAAEASIPASATMPDGEEGAALRRRIGVLFTAGGESARIITRYKQEHGGFQTWDLDTLRACVDECARANAEKQGAQA